MKGDNPPVLATWILERLIPGNRNDALSGDLLEEFRSGRSSGWYWRQALAAVANGCIREGSARSLLVVFAALWILPARIWWHFAYWSATHWGGLIFPWPYPSVLGMAIVVFQSLWVGLALYILLYSRAVGNVSLDKVWCGFWIGPLVFALLSVAIQIVSHPLGIGLGSRAWLKVVTYFVSLVAAAWGVRPRTIVGAGAKV